FKYQKTELKLMAKLIGTDALDDLLRFRFDDAKEYLDNLQHLNFEDMNILSSMVNSKKIDGKPFISTEKAEMIDTLLALKAVGYDFNIIKSMIENNAVDIAKLHADLLNQIFLRNGLTQTEIDSIPEERKNAWNLKYMHLLAKQLKYNGDKVFNDLIRVASLGDLKTYIHDTSNPYGVANAKTQELFKELGLNYDLWVNPPKSCEVDFVSKDATTDRLEQIATQVEEDINHLRQNDGAKKVIDKIFAKCIKDDKFIIPSTTTSSKEKLENFIKNLRTQLNGLFERASKNNNQAVMTIKDHLEQRMADIQGVQKSGAKVSLKWKIKMWDRIPQKDIFQGNYSTCCIGMAGGNGAAMPHYIMNTAFNMIEITDTKSGKVVGNALCYYAQDENGNPIFVIDNVEINNHNKTSNETGVKLRTAICEYIKNLNKEVGNGREIPVIIGHQFNDIPADGLNEGATTLKVLGDIDCPGIYMDLYTGWAQKDVNMLVNYFELFIPKVTPTTTSKPATTSNLSSKGIAINDEEAMEEIYELEDKTFSHLIKYDDVDEYTEYLMSKNISTYRVNGKDGNMLGYYQVHTSFPQTLYIETLNLKPEFRGKKTGFTTHAFEEITALAKKRGVKKLSLHVEVDNETAIELYKRNGFEIVKTEKGMYANGKKDAYYMEKRLSTTPPEPPKDAPRIKKTEHTAMSPHRQPAHQSTNLQPQYRQTS
nr:GNAT family N-acetyltransferase [Candidatus Gastranaerophilales bacterium]